MKYMGSKSRIANQILPLMLNGRAVGQYWVEPFVGGGNMIDKVDGNRIGSDLDKYAISGLKSIRDCIHELPRNNIEFTEFDYSALRADDSYKHKGYAGYALSYGGKWLGGWRRDRAGIRDYVCEAFRNAVKQTDRLQGVDLRQCDYRSLKVPDRSIVYCDPPYAGTTGYSNGFDSSEFWEWCRHMGRSGHRIFVSEYDAPGDFECVFEKSIASSLTKDTGAKTGTERLFKYNEHN